MVAGKKNAMLNSASVACRFNFPRCPARPPGQILIRRFEGFLLSLANSLLQGGIQRHKYRPQDGIAGMIELDKASLFRRPAKTT